MKAAPALTRLRPRERAGDRTRARLFDAAIAEFRRVGVERANVGDIARAARISRPSFYFHFPSKEHVLLELKRNLEEATVERLEGGRNLRETLDLFVETMVDAERSFGELLRDILILYARRPPHLDLDQPMPLVGSLNRRFGQGAAAGELRVDLDPEAAARLCLRSVFGYLIVGGGSPEERRADLRRLVSLYLSPDDDSARGGRRRGRRSSRSQ